MKNYEVEVVVHYKFIVSAENPYQAYEQAHDLQDVHNWLDSYSDSSVERIVISENNTELITY
jgi:hypothetical protein